MSGAGAKRYPRNIPVGIGHFSEEEEEVNVGGDCVDIDQCLLRRLLVCVFLKVLGQTSRYILDPRGLDISHWFCSAPGFPSESITIEMPRQCYLGERSHMSLPGTHSASYRHLDHSCPRGQYPQRWERAHFNLRTITGDIPNYLQKALYNDYKAQMLSLCFYESTPASFLMFWR